MYAELQVTTNYSFLRSGSHPGELALQALGLGHTAIGIADRNTLAGVVRAYAALKEYYEEHPTAKPSKGPTAHHGEQTPKRILRFGTGKQKLSSGQVG